MKSPGRIDEIARLLADHAAEPDDRFAKMSDAEIRAEFARMTARYSVEAREVVASMVEPLGRDWRHDTFDLYREAEADFSDYMSLANDDDFAGSMHDMGAAQDEVRRLICEDSPDGEAARIAIVTRMIQMDEQGLPPDE